VPFDVVVVMPVTVGATESKLLASWEAAVEVLPAASVAAPIPISTVTEPCADGEICAVYEAPDPDKLATEPLPTMMSLAVKSVTDSLNVMVTGIGEVFVGLPAGEESVTVGAVVSITKAFPPANDDALPRLGSVNTALALPPSVMVAPFITSALVERY
jgi:hypothetical protein